MTLSYLVDILQKEGCCNNVLLVASHIDAKDSVSYGYSSTILALSDEINRTLMYLSLN